MNAFISPPQSITALWWALSFHHTEAEGWGGLCCWL